VDAPPHLYHTLTAESCIQRLCIHTLVTILHAQAHLTPCQPHVAHPALCQLPPPHVHTQTQVLVKAFVRNRNPDPETVAALAATVAVGTGLVRAWFTDRNNNLPPEAAVHFQKLADTTTKTFDTGDEDYRSSPESETVEGRLTASSIRERITEALEVLDPPRFILRGELWDLVNVSEEFTNKQVRPRALLLGPLLPLARYLEVGFMS
jgi:hypothetical protein